MKTFGWRAVALVAGLAGCDAAGDGLVGTATPVVAQARATLIVVQPHVGASVTSLPMTVRVHNPGVADLALQFIGTEAAIFLDIEVIDADGVMVWQLLPGGLPAQQSITTRFIPAGGILEFQVGWPLRDFTGARVAPGTYEIRARLFGSPHDLVTPPVTITVLPFG